MYQTISHDPVTKTLTIVVSDTLTVEFSYHGKLPADWESRAPDYEEQAKNLLNDLLVQREKAFDFFARKNILKGDPEYMVDPNNERQWLEGSGGAANMCFQEVVCDAAVWNPSRVEYLFVLRTTDPNKPRTP